MTSKVLFYQKNSCLLRLCIQINTFAQDEPIETVKSLGGTENHQGSLVALREC